MSLDKTSISVLTVEGLGGIEIDDKTNVRDENEDYVYSYEFPKTLQIKWAAYAYVSEGSIIPNSYGEFDVGEIRFGIEFPDQEIRIEYTRTNNVDGTKETFTVNKQFKDIQIASGELSKRRRSKGKFYGGLKPVAFIADENTVYLEYD